MLICMQMKRLTANLVADTSDIPYDSFTFSGQAQVFRPQADAVITCMDDIGQTCVRQRNDQHRVCSAVHVKLQSIKARRL